MRDFLLGIAASYIAAILFSRIQPYVPPFLLSKLLRLIRLPILRIRQSSINRAFTYAAAGYTDHEPFILLIIFILAIIYAACMILYSITEPILSNITSIIGPIETLPKLAMAFLLLFLAYIFAYVASIISIAIHLDKCYKWRLEIIAPYISLKEEKELKATWALMKNKSDYEQINQKLNSVAETNGVVLPEPFLNVLKI